MHFCPKQHNRNHRHSMAVVLMLGLALSQASLNLPVFAQQKKAPKASAPPPAGTDPTALRKMTPQLAPTATSTAPSNAKAQPSASAAPSTTKAQSTMKHSTAAPPVAPAIEKYGQVAELEKLMFGSSQPTIPIEYRLDRLESEVFHETHPDWDAKHRTDRLYHTLIGGGPVINPPAPQPTPYDSAAMPYPPNNSSGPPNYPTPSYPYLPEQTDPPPAQAAIPQYQLQEPAGINSPDFLRAASAQELQAYALELINEMRTHQGVAPLGWDELAAKVAASHIEDLAKRNTVSHANGSGHNPDVRYTKAGGTDCMLESLVAVRITGSPVMNKSLVYNLMKELTAHQDDRDAMTSPHATNAAFSCASTSGQDKVIGIVETVIDQGTINPIPAEVQLGEKIEISGELKAPYKFQKITLAWEGVMPPPEEGEQQDEAMPYFPPLDYEAFARKSEHDYTKAVRLMQVGGIGLAIAGGLFFPPVALAAPLIAASGGNMKPKAVSEIPIRGGVKVDGNRFEHHTPVATKDNKEGIYYITVWASTDDTSAPIPVSRRAVLATAAVETVQSDEKRSKKKEKKADLISADNKKSEKKKKGTKDDLLSANSKKSDPDKKRDTNDN